MARKALGRGLNALIPQGNESPDQGKALQGASEIPLDQIEPNKDQPRKTFHQEELEGLADSIRTVGIIEPLVLRKQGNKFEIITGERRWRAAHLAELKSVPAIIKDVSDNEMLEMALIENIQREDLNPIEEAQAYRELLDHLQLKQDELAKRVGKSRTALTNALRLLSLPADIKQYLIEGRLSAGHARALLMIKSKTKQSMLAQKALKQNMSVRELEKLAGKQSPGDKGSPEKKSSKPADIRNLEGRLEESLGTPVSIKHGKNGGRIEITYYDLEDLERILDVVGG